MTGSDIEPATGKGDARGYSWPPFQPGHTVSMKHGAWSPRRVEPLALELVEATIEAATATGTTTSYLADPSYRPALYAWARCEAQIQLLTEWLMAKADETNAGGAIDPDGEIRPAAALLTRLEGQALKHRAQLGLDPLSRARLKRDSAAAEVDVAQLLTRLAQLEADTPKDPDADDQ